MITIRASIGGIPFTLDIKGKEVIFTDHTGKKTQWFPPNTREVFANLSKEEYAQWRAAATEEDVFKIIKFDLIRNQCRIISETRV